jgi:hypothetical protein
MELNGYFKYLANSRFFQFSYNCSRLHGNTATSFSNLTIFQNSRILEAGI